MTVGADRRSVLTGLGALGLMGCDRPDAPSAQDAPEREVIPFVPLDLSALEARHGGRLGVATLGPQGTAYWRAHERFLYCSTFKLFLAAATLMRAAAGQEQLDRLVPITQADMLPHAPITGEAVGRGLSIERLAQAAVEQSDNPAANILIREMGGLDVLREWYRSMGDSVTSVDRWEMELNRPDGDKDTTTPHQTIVNMVGLTKRNALTRRDAGRLERWMIASPTGPNRIKAGVPTGWTVAHKTGTGGSGPTNDIGVAGAPTGEIVQIAIYFHATSDSTPAQRDAVIADATRAALAALGYE